VLGLVSASGDRFLGWCHNTDNTWGNVARDGNTPSPITGSFTTPSINAGNYRVEWWDTYAGTITSQNNVNGWGGGGMTLTLPASITTDCAVKIINTGGGGDTTAPGNTSNLATSSPTSSSITLTWTAPGMTHHWHGQPV